MNFEQWYKKHIGLVYSPSSDRFKLKFSEGCFDGWNACKNEVLKILTKKDTGHKIVYNEACAQGVIEEIENL